MTSIPTNEPLQFRAGDTTQWRRVLSDYPAGTWTLTYYLVGGQDTKSIIASADGTDHAVTIAATVSSKYEPGVYKWIARVSAAGVVKTIDEGRFTILPDLTTLTPEDARDHAEIVLAAVKAVIEGRASRDQESYSINGRSLSRTPLADLLRLKTYYESEVAKIRRIERRKAGLSSNRRVVVRL